MRRALSVGHLYKITWSLTINLQKTEVKKKKTRLEIKLATSIKTRSVLTLIY